MNFFSIITALIIIFILWRFVAFKLNTLKRDRIITDKLLPLIKQLENKEDIDLTLVNELSNNPLTRRDALLLLTHYKNQNLFPKKYNTEVLLAESDLVRYLLHPNELGSQPSQIEHYKTINSADRKYHIFKFKKENDQKWYIGISGATTFSSGNIFSENLIEKELEYIYKNTK